VPTIITQILAGRKTLALGATHPTRDLNFVKDTVSGFISALESDNGTGQVINLGSGREIGIGDLAGKIAAMMDSKIEIKTDEERIRPEKSEVERLLADNRKAFDLLGWKPAFTLEQGLEETIRWFREPGNRSFYHSTGYTI